MLRQVLQEIQAAQGAVSINELSRKLGVEPAALEAMIAFLVRKGRLKEERLGGDTGPCADSDCTRACPGAQSCTLLRDLPRIYSPVRTP